MHLGEIVRHVQRRQACKAVPKIGGHSVEVAAECKILLWAAHAIRNLGCVSANIPTILLANIHPCLLSDA